jgi:putative DNA primase/helicase
VVVNAVEQQFAAVMPDIFADAAPTGITKPTAAGTIVQGGRNTHLASLAGSMRERGMTPEAITAGLLEENVRSCHPPLEDAEVRTIAQSIGRYAPTDTGISIAKAFTLAELSAHTFPERRPVLSRGDTIILREGHLAEVHGQRGYGKTWFQLTLALVIAAGVRAMGFSASEPRRVLDVDGEMASCDIQDRLRVLCERLGVTDTALLSVVAADWQDNYLRRLDTPDGQDAIEPHVDAADVVILDNRSSLFHPDGEKDPTAWQPAQDYLLSLRRRGKAVILIHHSNRMGGARGHSKAEDPLDLIVALSRPEDYTQGQGARFTVTFEKSRGAYGSDVDPFLAELTEAGWTTSSVDGQKRTAYADRLIEYLRIAHKADDRPKSANAAAAKVGGNRNAVLAAWADLLEAGVIRKHHEGGFFVS